MRISDWSSDVCSSDLWIDEAAGSVCISTFTKALQRQLARETARLYPDPAEHREKVVVRKGRENYLCLLNLEDAPQGGFSGRAAVLALLVRKSVVGGKMVSESMDLGGRRIINKKNRDIAYKTKSKINI